MTNRKIRSIKVTGIMEKQGPLPTEIDSNFGRFPPSHRMRMKETRFQTTATTTARKETRQENAWRDPSSIPRRDRRRQRSTWTGGFRLKGSSTTSRKRAAMDRRQNGRGVRFYSFAAIISFMFGCGRHRRVHTKRERERTVTQRGEFDGRLGGA